MALLVNLCHWRFFLCHASLAHTSGVVQLSVSISGIDSSHSSWRLGVVVVLILILILCLDSQQRPLANLSNCLIESSKTMTDEDENNNDNNNHKSISHNKQPNSRPTVMISSYYECKSKFRLAKREDTNNRDKNNNNNNNSLEDSQEIISTTSTKPENSTNFFINNLKRSHGRGRVLSNLIFSQIRGPTGSVRGHKDVVRKSLEGIKVTYNSGRSSSSLSLSNSCGSADVSLLQQQQQISHQSSGFYNQKRDLSSLNQLDELYCQEYLMQLFEDEQDCCVAYTTTLGVIRRTFEDSKLLRSILNLNLINYEERDIYLNQDYRNQLKLRLNSFIVPAIFVDGQHLGGVKELELMNENGELQKRLAKFKMSSAPRSVCLCCGNARFIACPSCNGSRKSAIHHFKFNSIALRCIKCDKNHGLVQCPVCRLISRPGEEVAVAGADNNNSNSIKEIDENNNNDNSEQSKTVHILNGDDENKQQFSSC